MRKVVLDLESCASLQDSVRLPNSSGEHMTLLPGYGDVDFRFPDVKTIVNKALARLAGAGTGRDKDEDTTDGANGTKAPEETGGKPSESQPPADDDGDDSSPESAPEADDDGEAAMHGPRSRRVPLIRHRVSLNGQKGLPRFPVDTLVAPKQLLSALPDDLENMDGTLFLAAGGLALIMDEGKYDAIVAERFDPLAGAVNWALSHMEESYQPAILSLKKQLDKLQVLYKTALPRVLAVLEGQNPDVDQRVLEQAAVEAMDEQLVQILTVLRIWTDAFAQRRDGMYPQLEAITYVVNEAFKLQTQSDKCKGKINTVVFQVGSVFVARYSNEGPATLPGTRGPIKAHAIECNHSQRKCSSLVLVLYLHEFRHNIFADIEGLAKEVILTTVVGKLREAYDQGQIKLSSDKITFAGNELNMIDVITKILVDNTPEIDADLAGGVLLSGWAYALNMVMTFSALNVGHDGVLRAGPMLRSGSYYRLKKSKGQVALSFLPHPPDYIRAYIVAAALDEIGFPAEAQKCRRLADQAAGSPLPKFIVWKDLSGKSKESIKILVDDLKQVAPVVAKAMIRTPLQALGGQCMFDILNWNKHRQGKVDILKEILMKGGSDLPTDIGDIYGTYVAAAATLAYWGLLEKGVRPVVAAASVEENMLKMMFALRDRQKKFEAENPNHDACEGEADKDAAPSSGTTGGAAAGDAKPAKPVKKKTAGKKTKPKPAKKKQS